MIPLLKLTDNIFLSQENLNPSGSIKWKPVKTMCDSVINNSDHIVESTSSNTGLAVALYCQQQGFPCTIVLPKSSRQFIINQLEEYGANIILTNASDGSDGSYTYVKELCIKRPNYYTHLDQYNNPLNPYSHYISTGPDIWQQTEGKLTHCVIGLGSCGTITGVGRFLKQMNHNIKIIGVQPADWYGISGLRKLKDSFVPGNYDASVVDKTIFIKTEDVLSLYKKDIYPGGFSTMANILAYHQIPYDKDNFVVTMMPDGSNYGKN